MKIQIHGHEGNFGDDIGTREALVEYNAIKYVNFCWRYKYITRMKITVTVLDFSFHNTFCKQFFIFSDEVVDLLLHEREIVFLNNDVFISFRLLKIFIPIKLYYLQGTERRNFFISQGSLMKLVNFSRQFLGMFRSYLVFFQEF